MKIFNLLPTKTAKRLAITLTGKAISFALFGLLLLTAADINAHGQAADNFNPNVINTGTSSSLSTIQAIVRQPDGKVLIGGVFTTVGGQTRNKIARLNTDGTIDPTFNSPFVSNNPNEVVRSLALQTDGKILIGGFFVLNQQQGIFTAVMRLNADGSIDSSFNQRVDGDVKAILVSPDGKILIGGVFTNIGTSPNVATRPFIARLFSDGTLDGSFNPAENLQFSNTSGGGGVAGVQQIIQQPDGKIIIGGFFRFFNGAATFIRNGIARINTDGTFDSFNPELPSGGLLAVVLQLDGKILIGGVGFGPGGGFPRKNIARVNSDGSLDGSFDAMFTEVPNNTQVNKIALQPDGKILVGGQFVQIGGQPRDVIARLNSNGSADSFSVNTFGSASSIVVQPDGKILVGGNFSTMGGQPRNNIARLNPNNTRFDFDGDGKADVSVFRPSNGAWYLQQSQAGFTSVGFGISTDKIVPADYDGDGKTDVAVYRAGTWYLNRSTQGFTSIGFGTAEDIPAPADFDGDGLADVAVFRPSNGTWYLQRSQLGFTSVNFGQSGDKPVAADYDGDGKADVAVFRGGVWYLLRSQLGFVGIGFGTAEDKPAPADYDGDGKADVAVFRPSNGTWYLQQSQAGFTSIGFGISADVPSAADYDGDGKADVAVFRNGTWYLNRTTQGFAGIAFGSAGDKPAPNAFVP